MSRIEGPDVISTIDKKNFYIGVESTPPSSLNNFWKLSGTVKVNPIPWKSYRMKRTIFCEIIVLFHSLIFWFL